MRGRYNCVDIEHPKLLSLLAFWESKRGGRRMPRRSDIDVLELAPWLGNLILMEVVGSGEDFIYRVYGTNLVRMIQHDLTNKSTTNLKSEARLAVVAEYSEVAASGQPLYVRQRRTVMKGQLMLSKLVVPLSENGERVDRLLVGVYPSILEMDESLPDRLGGLVAASPGVALRA
ncbi:MAG: PAS domain-containing protein [Proteobacteria bacterium]|nr:PAS domain-containing protein [Pseudomonadota bacterium]